MEQRNFKTETAESSVDSAFSEKQMFCSKQFVTPKQIEPGMFVFADGLVYPEAIDGHEIVAVVGVVRKGEALAVVLKEACLPWSSDGLFVHMHRKVTGAEATLLILDAAEKSGKRAEAAQWCADFCCDGIEPGRVFLPSATELASVLRNKTVCTALRKTGEELSSLYWSASQVPSGYVWYVYSGLHRYQGVISNMRPVRGMLSLKF